MSEGLNKLRIYKDILRYGSYAEQRRAVIQHYGLDNLFQKMKDDYIQYSKTSKTDYEKVEFKKVVDNFDALIQEALEKVQYLENFKLFLSKKKAVVNFKVK